MRSTPASVLPFAVALFAALALACGSTDSLKDATAPDGDDAQVPAAADPTPIADLDAATPPVAPEMPPDAAMPGPGSQPPPSDPPPSTGGNAIDLLPACAKPIVASFSIAEMQPPGVGSNGYIVPAAARLTALRASFTAFVKNDGAEAMAAAASGNYTLCRGTGAEAELVLWRPAPGEGQPWIALRTSANARHAIFEAPHPVFDSGTLEQAAYLFDHLNGRALIASGTHRCANAQMSVCDGTTDVCGANEPYRVSDMAHETDTIYQAAHEVLSDAFPQDWVLAMHGMAATGASISNGTTDSTTPTSPSAKIALEYTKHFSGVTTCNPFNGVPTRNHLCATTTPQGRYLNGSPNVCTTQSTSASGRFIHIEQNKSVRTDLVNTAAAIDAVIP